MNAEIVMQANQNPVLAEIIQQADLITADGAGIVFALSWYGIEQTKCAGIELGEALLGLANNNGDSLSRCSFMGANQKLLLKLPKTGKINSPISELWG